MCYCLAQLQEKGPNWLLLKSTIWECKWCLGRRLSSSFASKKGEILPMGPCHDRASLRSVYKGSTSRCSSTSQQNVSYLTTSARTPWRDGEGTETTGVRDRMDNDIKGQWEEVDQLYCNRTGMLTSKCSRRVLILRALVLKNTNYDDRTDYIDNTASSNGADIKAALG